MREPSQRMRRVNEALKEILSETINRGLKDPRVGFVTITAVHTTSDLRHAKVYLSVLGRQGEKDATLKGLRSAEGYLQSVINQELHIKRTPALEFIYDESIDQGMRISSLIRTQERDLGLDLGEEPTDPVADDGVPPADGSETAADGGDSR